MCLLSLVRTQLKDCTAQGGKDIPVTFEALVTELFWRVTDLQTDRSREILELLQFISSFHQTVGPFFVFFHNGHRSHPLNHKKYWIISCNINLGNCKKHLSYFPSHTHLKVVLYYKYCRNDWMNMKFISKLPRAIENVLEFSQFFQNWFNRWDWLLNTCHTYGFGGF